MIAVGWWSSAKSQHSTSDYLLAGRSIGPISVGLSALATSLSGFMFIGYIGYVYTTGYSGIWYLLTWALGDLLAWFTVHKKLREKSESLKVDTITAFISTDSNKTHKKIVQISSIISLFFLIIYSSAQLKTSSKALHSIMHIEQFWGVIIAGLIVFLYSYSGGVRSSISTNVIQAIMMCVSMQILCISSIIKVGGLNLLTEKLGSIDPQLINFAPQSSAIFFAIFLFSLFVNGYGVIGQPHIMSRPMTLENPSDMKYARNVYIIGYMILGLGSYGVGLTARVLMPEMINLDPELAFPYLSINLLPGFLVGLMLAGVFAAALSTADSQILSCSASLTQDLLPKYKNSFSFSRIATILFTIASACFALFSSQNVFDLVIVAWAILAVCFGPLVFMRCFDIPVSPLTAITMMLSSGVAVMVWRYVLHLNEIVHETLIGLICSLIIFGISRYDKKSFTK
jgi:sodium/proline symporter